VLVWRSQLVALHRVKGKRGKPTPGRAFVPPDRSPDRLIEFSAPEDIGRAYGRVAGDINPIHINALAAKAFGFPKAIAHGTWTAARALAAVSDLLPDPGPQAVHHTIVFVRPVFLPAKLTLVAWQQGSQVWWQVQSGPNGKTVHVRGEASYG
jgi:acyl dehydratase